MTRDQLREFQKEASLLFSSLFARKMSRIIFGAEDGAWYYCNMKYRKHPDRTKRKDEFFMYSPDPDHAIHCVTFRDAKAYAKVRAMMQPLEKYKFAIMMVTAHFQSAIKKLYSYKEAEKIKIHFLIDKANVFLVTTVTLPEDKTVKEKFPVGHVFQPTHTARIIQIGSEVYTTVHSGDTVSVELPPARFDKGDVAVLDITVEDGIYRIGVIDGHTNVCVNEYGKKSKMEYKLTAHSWRSQGSFWYTALQYVDDAIDVVSFPVCCAGCPVKPSEESTDG